MKRRSEKIVHSRKDAKVSEKVVRKSFSASLAAWRDQFS